MALSRLGKMPGLYQYHVSSFLLLQMPYWPQIHDPFPVPRLPITKTPSEIIQHDFNILNMLPMTIFDVCGHSKDN